MKIEKEDEKENEEEQIFVKRWKSGNRQYAIAVVAKLLKSPYNVRAVNDVDVEELAKNIKRRGLIYPPIVDSKGYVFVGWNRVRAYKLNKAKYIQVIVFDGSPHEKLMASFDENYYRKNMHFLDEGKCFDLLCRMLKISHRKLAKTLNVSRKYVDDRINCWNYLSGSVGAIKQSQYNEDQDKRVTFEKAREIANDRIPKEYRRYLIERIINEGMSYTDLSKYIESGKDKEWILDQADFSERQIVEKKVKEVYGNIWNPELSVEELENMVRVLRNLPLTTRIHRVNLDKLFNREIRLTNTALPKYFVDVVRAFFRYYGGALRHFEVVVVGTVSRELMNKKKPFKEDMVRKYFDLEPLTKQKTLTKKTVNINGKSIKDLGRKIKEKKIQEELEKRIEDEERSKT